MRKTDGAVLHELQRWSKLANKWVLFNVLLEITGVAPRDLKRALTRLIADGLVTYETEGPTRRYRALP